MPGLVNRLASYPSCASGDTVLVSIGTLTEWPTLGMGDGVSNRLLQRKISSCDVLESLLPLLWGRSVGSSH